ncbi:MAG: MAPEG family protein [Blastomonas sp.]
MGNNILTPAAVLVIWSLIMLFWTAATRFPAIAKAGLDIKNAAPGGRGQDLEGVLPPKVQWKAHNYAHLMEQPTLFYAVIAILAITGGASQTAICLAWTYVGLRIAHSLWQATVNTIMPVRFGLFLLSTIVLVILSVIALLATLEGA